jgi:hypothetical protein
METTANDGKKYLIYKVFVYYEHMPDKNVKSRKRAPLRDKSGRWLPGQSPNAKGRPANKKFVSEAMAELLAADRVRLEYSINGVDEVLEIEAIRKTNADNNIAMMVAAKMLTEALSGNVQAFKEIADRTEGKAIQGIDVKGNALPAVTVYLPENNRN